VLRQARSRNDIARRTREIAASDDIEDLWTAYTSLLDDSKRRSAQGSIRYTMSNNNMSRVEAIRAILKKRGVIS